MQLHFHTSLAPSHAACPVVLHPVWLLLGSFAFPFQTPFFHLKSWIVSLLISMSVGPFSTRSDVNLTRERAREREKEILATVESQMRRQTRPELRESGYCSQLLLSLLLIRLLHFQQLFPLCWLLPFLGTCSWMSSIRWAQNKMKLRKKKERREKGSVEGKVASLCQARR